MVCAEPFELLEPRVLFFSPFNEEPLDAKSEALDRFTSEDDEPSR